MLELKRLDELGKPYKIFTDEVEGGAIEQFVAVMQQPDVVQGALMPDVHSGYVMPIGGVVATKGTIYPAFVGYDIGCGVSTVQIGISKDEVEQNLERIRDTILATVPVGFNCHHHNYPTATLAKRIGKSPDCIDDLVDNHLHQVATLGGGNHFVEVGYDASDKVWLSIHSGSRGLGHSVASRFMAASGGEGINPIGVDTELGRDYIRSLDYSLRWALFNREKMMRNICEALNVAFMEPTMINRNHNHAEEKDGLWIHRKGATHAEKDMMGVIPGNMRDGVFIVRGLGNPDSLCSSSHGAGRVLSRSKAKKLFNFDDLQDSLRGRDLKGYNISPATVDEGPFAYKNIFEVLANQKDLIEVVEHIKPLINVKG